MLVHAPHSDITSAMLSSTLSSQDQAYQYLVQWSAGSPKEPSQGESQQERTNESRDVCPRLHAAAGADADALHNS